MAPLTDGNRLRAYKDALSNWQFDDHIQFDLTEEAHAWVRREFDGITFNEIARLMHELMEIGGEIVAARETRPEWSGEYEFHHDLRFTIQGVAVYIETRLHSQSSFVPDESWILVVNIHAQ